MDSGKKRGRAEHKRMRGSIDNANPAPQKIVTKGPRSPVPPIVESHPAPRLHSGRLDRSMGVLQPQPECVVVRAPR